ncbi:hypothetical protein JVT61DRAFT_11027 [Boletus reticuloceps]|uniref:Uncharacterized protein n=1 Tax=Boletus reticuloceps TaxID=495285 RepID=A0A8I3A4I4_9AGAM|nr:hypothetical protein JVT61DRAFT_11027 [Boletus reticuloceps]
MCKNDSPNTHALSPPSFSFWPDAHACPPAVVFPTVPCTTSHMSTRPPTLACTLVCSQQRRGGGDDDVTNTCVHPRPWPSQCHHGSGTHTHPKHCDARADPRPWPCQRPHLSATPRPRPHTVGLATAPSLPHPLPCLHPALARTPSHSQQPRDGNDATPSSSLTLALALTRPGLHTSDVAVTTPWRSRPDDNDDDNDNVGPRSRSSPSPCPPSARGDDNEMTTTMTMVVAALAAFNLPSSSPSLPCARGADTE